MRTKALLVIIGVVVGLGIGLSAAVVVGTNDNVRSTLFAGSITPTAVPIESQDPVIRGVISRDNIDESTYYITQYENTLEWLEEQGINFDDFIEDEFSRVEEQVTMNNFGDYFEDPKSAVNTVLGFVFTNLINMLPPHLRGDSVEVCLALQSDLRQARVVNLYLRVPTEANLELPEEWQVLSEPPEENSSWRSECLEELPKR